MNRISRIIKEEISKYLNEDEVGGATTTNGMTPDHNAGGYVTPFGADKATADRSPGFSMKRLGKKKTK